MVLFCHVHTRVFIHATAKVLFICNWLDMFLHAVLNVEMAPRHKKIVAARAAVRGAPAVKSWDQARFWSARQEH